MSSATRPTRCQWMPDRGTRVMPEGGEAMGVPSPPPGWLLLAAKDAAPRVRRVPTQRLLDPQELVVLRHAVRARRRAGLDLAAAGGHGEVGDRRVLGLARTVRHD